MAYQLIGGEVVGSSPVKECPFCQGQLDSSFVPGRDAIVLGGSPASEARVEIILEHECGHAPDVEFKIIEPLSF